jgi:hypothetical protein
MARSAKAPRSISRCPAHQQNHENQSLFHFVRSSVGQRQRLWLGADRHERAKRKINPCLEDTLVKTTTLLWLVLGVSLVPGLGAGDADKPWYSAQTGVMSQYLGLIGPIFYNSPVAVSEITVGYLDWYGGVWNSTGLGGDRYGQTYGDEFDIYGGWAHTFGWIRCDLSGSYYTISRLDRMGGDLWVVEPEVSFPKFPYVQPYFRCRYFGRVGSQSPELSTFWFAGVRKEIVLGNGTAGRSYVLNLQASTVYAEGEPTRRTGFVYGRLTTSLDVPLSKHWTLNPSVIYQVPAPGQRSDPKGYTDGNELVYGASLKCKF